MAPNGQRLSGKTVGMLLGPGFEELEHWVPYMRLLEEGAMVRLIGDEAEQTYHGKHGALPATSEVAARDVATRDLEALLVPGGYAPDKMRRDEHLVRLVRETFEATRPLGLICHAGSMAISAGIIGRGMRAAGSLGIKDDLVVAGAVWTDEPAFREGCIIWGRHVNDLPAYCRLLVDAIGD